MGILEILEASNKFSKEIVDNHMKTIKEKVLLDMKTRHPEYECRNHEIAIDLTLKEVLEVIDDYEEEIKKEIIIIQKCRLKKLYSEEDKKRDLNIMRSRIVASEELKARINGK